MDAASITPTPQQLKALTHPVRLRMLGILRTEGATTATALAQRLGLNTGATSYHLRQLAQHGFIVDDDSQGNGRERWWRAAHASTHYEPSRMLADPESAAAGRVMRQTFLQGHLTEQLAYLDAEPALPLEWVEAATAGDTIAYLTPDELRQLSDEVNALAEKWDVYKDAGRAGVAPVRFIYSSFRQP